MMTDAIRIKGISKKFGQVQALSDVSFNVPTHSIFGLLGPNGAGKTTLFSIAADFLKPDAGHIEVLGIDTRDISRLRGRMSILPQDARFQNNVPILEQFILFRLLAGSTKTQAREEVLKTFESVGLQTVSKNRVGSLSHGMIKRLGIAQAFLGNPEVILLDEPTAGLDPANARQIRDLIKRLQESATVIVSSHNMAEIQELCDHVAILNHGKLMLSGSVHDITLNRREYNLTLSRAFTGNEQEGISALKGVSGVELVSQSITGSNNGTTEYTVKLDLSGEKMDQDEVISNLLHHILGIGITPRRLNEGRNLEKQFLEVTDKGEC
jgi:ABC-type multidrug transport system ATPase subunit